MAQENVTAEVNVKNVVHVVYPDKAKSKYKNAFKYDAVGVCKMILEKDDPRLQDKCAFSQYDLTEIDCVGAIICAQNDASAVGNQWRFLCSSEISKIHLFDAEYLKNWISIKGCEFIQCPLCKSGAEEKMHIEEHDIDSMEQLKERRDAAKAEQDIYLLFFTEQLILDKACAENVSENASKLSLNTDLLREVFNHWISKKKVNEFRARIVEATLSCIACDNFRVLKIVLKYCSYDLVALKEARPGPRNDEMMRFLSSAARHSAMDCLRLLLKHTDKLDWSAQKRPVMLAEAVKHQNLDIIALIMAKLEALPMMFVCDDVMEQVIKYDLVDIAKRIVNNRWHKINQKDEALALSINLHCHEYFQERSRAFNFNKEADADDDDWGDEEDFDDDDDDWANAVETPREHPQTPTEEALTDAQEQKEAPN